MAWPLPPGTPGPGNHGRPGVTGLVGGVVERAVVEHDDLVHQAVPPVPVRKGWTTARTTEPTVEPSSRAGMHTETVVPVRAFASSTSPVGKSPW